MSSSIEAAWSRIVGLVITHSYETGEHFVLAPSLSAYLARIADAMEAGKYEYTEDDGLMPVDD